MFKRQDIQNLHQKMQQMQQTQPQFEAQRPVRFETILLQYLMWMEITRVLPNARLHFQCTSYWLSLLPPVCHPISYCKLAVRQHTTLETKLGGQSTDSCSLVVRLCYVEVSLLIWSACIIKKSLFHSAFNVFQDGRKDWQALLDGIGIQHHGYIIHSHAATGAHNESTLPHHSSCFQFFADPVVHTPSIHIFLMSLGWGSDNYHALSECSYLWPSLQYFSGQSPDHCSGTQKH